MKIKIISDGTVDGTKIVDAQTGERLAGVQMINWMSAVGGECEALMHVVGVQCEIVTDARAALLPDLNPYQAEDLPDDPNPSN